MHPLPCIGVTEKCDTRGANWWLLGALQNIVVPRLQTRPKEVGHHIEIVAMEGIKWFVWQGIRGVAETYKNLLTTYESTKVVCPLGLEAQKIHACPNDCILYRGEYENLDSCPVCNACRYKIPRDDPGDVEGMRVKKRVPAKVMWYFPLIPRLKYLFMHKINAKLMRWHKEKSKQDNMLRHPADG